MKRSLPTGLVVVLATLLPVSTARGQATSLRIEAGGRSTVIEASRVPGGSGFAASAILALSGTLSPVEGGIVAVLFDDTLRFQVGSPFFQSGDSVYPLANPVGAAGDAVILPDQFFTEWLPAHVRRVGYANGVLSVEGPVDFPEPERPDPPQRVVILDPGHGGDDTGKIGPNGVREKDAALQLGRRLADLLESRGYEVHLTRTRDTLIALDDRPRLANRWKAGRPAAVFVSLHFNSAAAAARSARGFETFFLSDARTEDEQRVADLENAAVQFEDGPSEPLSDEMFILNGLRNDFYVRASNDLAEVVQKGIGTVHDGPDRGVKRAGFRVLVGALMPAVLVEAAFISNAREARLIADPKFQDSLATAIAESLDRFFESHEFLWAGG